MSATSNTVPVISVSGGFEAVVVQGDSMRVEIIAGGSVHVQTHPRVTITAPSPGASKEPIAIGTPMPDGTIYAGISPDTRRPMYTTPTDTVSSCIFDRAAHYASVLNAHGHKDWRVPTRAELNLMFGNHAAIGHFDTSGSHPAGWYWHARLAAAITRGLSASAMGTTQSTAIIIPSTQRCVASGDE